MRGSLHALFSFFPNLRVLRDSETDRHPVVPGEVCLETVVVDIYQRCNGGAPD